MRVEPNVHSVEARSTLESAYSTVQLLDHSDPCSKETLWRYGSDHQATAETVHKVEVPRSPVCLGPVKTASIRLLTIRRFVAWVVIPIVLIVG